MAEATLAPGAAGSSSATQEISLGKTWDNTGMNERGYSMSYANRSAASLSLFLVLPKSNIN